MAIGQRLGVLAAGLLIGLFAATHFIAWAFYWSPNLGAGLRLSPDFTLYAPWNVFEWRERFGQEQFDSKNSLPGAQERTFGTG